MNLVLWRLSVLLLIVQSHTLTASGSNKPGWRATTTSFKQLPINAQKLLQQLPNREVTLDLVIQAGAAKSDSFQTIVAKRISSETPKFLTQAMIDTNIFAAINYLDDRQEPLSSFAASNQLNSGITLGVSKGFATGTHLTTQLTLGSFSYDLPAGLGIPSPGTRSNSELSISLSQDLWKNSFGKSTSLILESGEYLAEANKWSAVNDAEDWFLNLSDVFYGAWLAQSRARTASSSLVRSQRLAKITKIKLHRGTAEKPDFLQIQANIKNAEVAKEEAERQVNDIWRKLIVTLKFPPEWLSLTGMKVPVAIFPAQKSSTTLCGSANKINAPPSNTAKIEKEILSAKATKSSFLSKKDLLKPALSLELTAAGNAIDNDSGTALSESTSGKNPKISALLKFSMPLSNSLAKGEAMQAYRDQKLAEAFSSIAQSDLKVNWINACVNLFKTAQHTADLKIAFSLQSERARLEEGRFKNGRISAPQVILAEEDATRAELIWLQSEIDYRKAAWRIQKFSGGIKHYLTQLENKQTSSKKQ